MRHFVALAAAALLLAGCSSEASGSSTPAKRGCDGFDKQAVAKALGTTEPIMEDANPDSTCMISVGVASTTATTVTVNIRPDDDRGFASWRKTAGNVDKAVQDRSLSNGDKAFVCTMREHEAVAGVQHNGTFYKLTVISLGSDPIKSADAMVDVLATALG